MHEEGRHIHTQLILNDFFWALPDPPQKWNPGKGWWPIVKTQWASHSLFSSPHPWVSTQNTTLVISRGEMMKMCLILQVLKPWQFWYSQYKALIALGSLSPSMRIRASKLHSSLTKILHYSPWWNSMFSYVFRLQRTSAYGNKPSKSWLNLVKSWSTALQKPVLLED